MRTPDGQYKTIDEALSEWDSMAKPLQELGFDVHGYDPGISFKFKDCRGLLSIFTISCSDLKIINDALKR